MALNCWTSSVSSFYIYGLVYTKQQIISDSPPKPGLIPFPALASECSAWGKLRILFSLYLILLYHHIISIWTCGINVSWMCSPCRHQHHGAPSAEPPGQVPDPAAGPDDPVLSVLTHSQHLQMPLHPHLSSLHTAPVTRQGKHHAGPVVWIICPVAVTPLGSVSAPRLPPALCRDENKDCTEKTLQRLFHCTAAGTLVCVLQDKSEAQAEARIRWHRSVWSEESQSCVKNLKMCLFDLCYYNKVFWFTMHFMGLLSVPVSSGHR